MIRDELFTHLGSRGQKGTGSRIRIRNTAFLWTIFLAFLDLAPKNTGRFFWKHSLNLIHQPKMIKKIL